MPADLYASTAFGTSLVNSSRDSLEITDVEMIDARGLELASNSLMPSPKYNLLADAFPPVAQFPDQWPLAEPISETSVKPYDAHVSLVSEINLVEGEPIGSMDGLEISYRNPAGERFVLRTTHALEILRGSCE